MHLSSSSSSSLRSSRGAYAVTLLPSYLADARSVVPYSADHPDGALQLGVAESKMLEDWLVPILNEHQSSSASASPTIGNTSSKGSGISTSTNMYSSDAIYYQPTAGRSDCRDAVCTYVESLVGIPQGRLDRDGMIVGAGCNAVLENLCFALAEAGDAVLIPTPYYAAFEFDLVARAGLVVQPVTTMEFQKNQTDTTTSTETTSKANWIDPRQYYPNVAALDAAYQAALEAGSQPKILLLSHPHNPLGICYPSSVIQECIEWCREKQVHLISDEIYAGSVYRTAAAATEAGGNFESILAQAGTLGPYVHWVYALSKDFALSGLRVGAAYSENLEIRLPMQKLNDMCQISSTTQIWTKYILQQHKMQDGESWVSAFRRENHSRLHNRSQALTDVLDDFGVPYAYPTAGLFVWIDLSRYLKSEGSAVDRERELYLRLVNDYGVLFTPGLSMRNEKPGFFRCVFTAATDEEFSLALTRIQKFLSSSPEERQ